MKTNIKRLITISLLLAFAPNYSCIAQGTFRNLDFEMADLPIVPAGQSGGIVSISNALPNWRAFIGVNEVFSVQHNAPTLGSAAVTILGPSYGYSLQGSFTAMLQTGLVPSPGGFSIAAVSLSQTGMIPFGAQSMTFITALSAHDLSVSIGGVMLPAWLLSTSASAQVYGVEVSTFAGQLADLRFTSLIPASTPFNNFYLDDIIFSNQPIPEPTAFGLFALSTLLLGWRLRRTARM